MNALIRRLADATADARQETDERNRQSIAYGLTVLWNELTKLPLLLIAFTLLFSFREMLTAMAFWSILRVWMGGWHSRSWLGCLAAAAACYLAILALARHVLLSPTLFLVVMAVGLATVLLVAPVDHPNKPIRTMAKRRKMRLLASGAFLLEAAVAWLLPAWMGRIGFWTLLILVVMMLVGLLQRHPLPVGGTDRQGTRNDEEAG